MIWLLELLAEVSRGRSRVSTTALQCEPHDLGARISHDSRGLALMSPHRLNPRRLPVTQA